MLNLHHSSWVDVRVGVPLFIVILVPLLFLIYIHDLPNGFNSNAKPVSFDISPFSIY